MDCGYRADLVVERMIIVETKTIEAIGLIHISQVLTYLRFLHLRKGLILNFNTVLLKDGIKRVINGFEEEKMNKLWNLQLIRRLSYLELQTSECRPAPLCASWSFASIVLPDLSRSEVFCNTMDTKGTQRTRSNLKVTSKAMDRELPPMCPSWSFASFVLPGLSVAEVFCNTTDTKGTQRTWSNLKVTSKAMDRELPPLCILRFIYVQI